MGRFAIDTDYQGQGWGAELLREALLSAVSGGQAIGARALLVDAINEQTSRFYERFGFVASPIHPMQLHFDLRVVEASAGLG
jgi:ribosomal protein S18 acetylase RimI-like enzyme